MNCDQNKFEPLTPTPLLLQQVHDQSALCNVTIKVGQWEKRYHWCVLVASPFFSSMYEDNFLEKSTGSVGLHEWDETLVDTALTFLYGQPPSITDGNMEQLIQISEFLLIPNLKAACIAFLKNTTITMENCIDLLQMAEKYRFTWKECDTFVRAKLLELLQQDEMVAISITQLKSLLSDPTLTYVPVQDWFGFLGRWVRYKPTRRSSFPDLFNMLDFYGCNLDFLINTVKSEPLVKDVIGQVEDTLNKGFDRTKDIALILIRKNNSCFLRSERENIQEKFSTVNLRTMTSLQFDIQKLGIVKRLVDSSFLHDIGFVDASDSDSSVRLEGNYYHYGQTLSIRCHDVNTVQTSTSEVIWDDYFNKNKDTVYTSTVAKVSVAFDTVVAVTEREKPRDGLYSTCGVIDTRNILSTLHIGDLQSPVTEMKSKVSFNENRFIGIAVDARRTVALLSENGKDMFLYDVKSYSLTCIKLRKHGLNLGDNLSWYSYERPKPFLKALTSGFVLYSKDVLAHIYKPEDAKFGGQYQVKTLEWEENPAMLRPHYEYTGGLWVRHYRRKRTNGNEEENMDDSKDGLSRNDDTGMENGDDGNGTDTDEENEKINDDDIIENVLEYVMHEELMASEDVKLLQWHNIDWPWQKSRTRYLYKFFAVRLPKKAPICHRACPHCELRRLELVNEPSDSNTDSSKHKSRRNALSPDNFETASGHGGSIWKCLEPEPVIIIDSDDD